MKAGDFGIGLRDFLAILVPGSVFLLLLKHRCVAGLCVEPSGPHLFGFAVASYLIGSVAAALASLCDFVVDPLVEGRLFRNFPPKFLGKRSLDETTQVAAGLRADMLRDQPEAKRELLEKESLKSFWWSALRLDCPPAIAELDRLEANQKLFRSLVGSLVLVLLLMAYLHATGAPGPVEHLQAVWILAAAMVSFALYAGGRLRFHITLYRLAAAYAVRGS